MAITDIKNLLLSRSTELTLSDRRLYNYLLHHAIGKLPHRLDFCIALNTLEGVYGVSSPPIPRLKESLRRLMNVLVEFETTSRKWVITNLLERAELNESEEKLHYAYPLHCRVLLTNALTLEKCLIQAHFTQKYSNLLYDILSEAHYAKKAQVMIETADLRCRLHIADNKLCNYSDLERFAIIPAVKEINSYASFAVKFHTLRKGMKVTDIVFEMTTKRNILDIDKAKKIIPPKRPTLFIDNPDVEIAYSYLLNATTSERRKYFELALKKARKQKINIAEDEFDRPDLWFRFVEKELIKK